MEAMREEQAEKYEAEMWDFELKLKDLATEARRENLPEVAARIETCAGSCHEVWAVLWNEFNRLRTIRFAQPIADKLAKEVVSCQQQ